MKVNSDDTLSLKYQDFPIYRYDYNTKHKTSAQWKKFTSLIPHLQ